MHNPMTADDGDGDDIIFADAGTGIPNPYQQYALEASTAGGSGGGGGDDRSTTGTGRNSSSRPKSGKKSSSGSLRDNSDASVISSNGGGGGSYETLLQVGGRVEVNFRGRGKYFAGVVSRVRGNGNVDVIYDDGESESNVGTDMIRDIGNGSRDSKRPKSASRRRGDGK